MIWTLLLVVLPVNYALIQEKNVDQCVCDCTKCFQSSNKSVVTHEKFKNDNQEKNNNSFRNVSVGSVSQRSLQQHGQNAGKLKFQIHKPVQVSILKENVNVTTNKTQPSSHLPEQNQGTPKTKPFNVTNKVNYSFKNEEFQRILPPTRKVEKSVNENFTESNKKFLHAKNEMLMTTPKPAQQNQNLTSNISHSMNKVGNIKPRSSQDNTKVFLNTKPVITKSDDERALVQQLLGNSKYKNDTTLKMYANKNTHKSNNEEKLDKTRKEEQVLKNTQRLRIAEGRAPALYSYTSLIDEVAQIIAKSLVVEYNLIGKEKVRDERLKKARLQFAAVRAIQGANKILLKIGRTSPQKKSLASTIQETAKRRPELRDIQPLTNKMIKTRGAAMDVDGLTMVTRDYMKMIMSINS